MAQRTRLWCHPKGVSYTVYANRNDGVMEYWNIGYLKGKISYSNHKVQKFRVQNAEPESQNCQHLFVMYL